MSQNDEELARRLQYEEEARQQYGRRTRSIAQEQNDEELARYYARMDMEHDGARSSGGPPRDAPRGHLNEYGVRVPNDGNSYGGRHSYRSSTGSYSEFSPSNGYAMDSSAYPDTFEYNRRGDSVSTRRRTMGNYSDSSAWDNGPYSAPPIPYAQNQHRSSSASEFLDRPYNSFSEGPSENRPRRGTHRRAATEGPKGSLEYARHLQEQALLDIQRNRKSAAALKASPNERIGSASDEELARKMQELENQGLGRLNSDRKLEDLEDMSSGSEQNNETPGPLQLYATKRREKSIQEDEDAKLARLIQESNVSLNQISPDVLKDIMQTGVTGQSSPERVPVPKVAVDISFNPVIHHSSSMSDVDARRSPNRSQSMNSGLRTQNKPTSLSVPTSPGLTLSPDRRQKGQVRGPASEKKSPMPSNNSPGKKKKRGFLSFGSRGKSSGKNSQPQNDNAVERLPPLPIGLPSSLTRTPTGIPAPIPPPPGGSLSAPPPISHRQVRSLSPPTIGGGVPRGIPPPPPGPPAGYVHARMNAAPAKKSFCAGCGQPGGPFLKALDKKYHAECFRCISCNGKIDPSSQFKFSSDPLGKKHPHHLHCYVEMHGIQCTVCDNLIPAAPDGKVAFVKHPFFSYEQMCVKHAEVPHRRCCSCQRFEPQRKPFIDLMDLDRCICPACCRTVIFESNDVGPLWKQVIYFFEFKLKLPVWDQMREIPILLVGYDELQSQMNAENSIHAQSTNPMTSGLCLTDGSSRLKMPSIRWKSSTSSFENDDEEFPCYYNFPGRRRDNQLAIVAILCLNGLPRDLTLSILAHEATHAWLKLHPKSNIGKPIPHQIEEGVAQLISFLFLSEIIENETEDAALDESDGPSDSKLRQYFKFTIERESHEIFGTGYRRAAMAYRDIGIEDLLEYVVEFGDFPAT